MTTPKQIIDTHLSGIVGQEFSVERVANSVASACNGEEMTSGLFTGAGGSGKSKLARAYGKALAEETGADYLYFASPADFRAKGEAYSSLITCLLESEKFVVVVDEAHLFDDAKTMQTRRVRNAIHNALDKEREKSGLPVRFDDEITFNFNRKKGAFILATNFPHKLDRSGAFQSRFDKFTMGDYTVKQLKEICKRMAKAAGLTISAGDCEMIAKTGRGTARPMEHIIGECQVIAGANGSKEMSTDQILRALIITKQYPRGLTDTEVKIMCRLDGASFTQTQLSGRFPALEMPELRRSLAYLQDVPNLKDDDESTQHFIGLSTGHALQLTDTGRRYLQTIAKAGFPVPAEYSAPAKGSKVEAKA